MKKKARFSLIANETSRKTTFKKRKNGIMKKLTELVTLCDVKACAVVYSPYNSNPEAWPSREAVEEVVSKFMEFSMEDRTKRMVDQEAFLHQMIDKEKEKLKKLCDENRDFQIRELMWGCLRGELDVHHFSEKDLQDLSSVIDKYVNRLTRRIENLTENGESSSLPSLVFANAAAVAAPIGFYDHMIQNQNHNQHKPVQFQYQTLIDFYDQIPKKIHEFNMNMNSNQNMILDLNQNLYVGEDEDIPSMDGNHYQPETDCHANIITTTVDACAPNITNNL